jgi:hypothetical protein
MIQERSLTFEGCGLRGLMLASQDVATQQIRVDLNVFIL